MGMTNDDIIYPTNARFSASRRPSHVGRPQGPVIDQEGREIPESSLRDGFRQFQFDFTHSSAV
jgi:hypothetical protein